MLQDSVRPLGYRWVRCGRRPLSVVTINLHLRRHASPDPSEFFAIIFNDGSLVEVVVVVVVRRGEMSLYADDAWTKERERTCGMFSRSLATKQVPRATEGLMNSAVFRRVLADVSRRVQW